MRQHCKKSALAAREENRKAASFTISGLLGIQQPTRFPQCGHLRFDASKLEDLSPVWQGSWDSGQLQSSGPWGRAILYQEEL